MQIVRYACWKLRSCKKFRLSGELLLLQWTSRAAGAGAFSHELLYTECDALVSAETPLICKVFFMHHYSEHDQAAALQGPS